MGLEPELGFAPDLGAIDADTLRPGAADVHQLPQQPDRRGRPRRRCSSARSSSPRAHDLLVVHDNAYSETTYDGYVAPSFLATPGAKEVGVEVFSLSKGYNMTGWRCAAIVGNAEAIEQYWRLKSNIDSGNFEAVQLAGAAALAPEVDAEVKAMNAVYTRRRDLVCDALAQAGVNVTPPKGTIYIWAPVPAGLCHRRRVLRARARAGGGRDLPRRRLRAQRGGLLPDLADHARRPPAGGCAAAEPSLTPAARRDRPLPGGFGATISRSWASPESPITEAARRARTASARVAAPVSGP